MGRRLSELLAFMLGGGFLGNTQSGHNFRGNATRKTAVSAREMFVCHRNRMQAKQLAS
jgi:hypothetical protein